MKQTITIELTIEEGCTAYVAVKRRLEELEQTLNWAKGLDCKTETIEEDIQRCKDIMEMLK